MGEGRIFSRRTSSIRHPEGLRCGWHRAWVATILSDGPSMALIANENLTKISETDFFRSLSIFFEACDGAFDAAIDRPPKPGYR